MDYYFYLHPPKDNDSTFGDDTVIDFDALTPRKRVQMKEEWTQDSRRGDPV